MGQPKAQDRCYTDVETPRDDGRDPPSKSEILRDEAQTERQAPENADPGEPAGGE